MKNDVIKTKIVARGPGLCGSGFMACPPAGGAGCGGSSSVPGGGGGAGSASIS